MSSLQPDLRDPQLIQLEEQSLHAQSTGTFLPASVDRRRDDDDMRQILRTDGDSDLLLLIRQLVAPVQATMPTTDQATKHLPSRLALIGIRDGRCQVVDAGLFAAWRLY